MNFCFCFVAGIASSENQSNQNNEGLTKVLKLEGIFDLEFWPILRVPVVVSGLLGAFGRLAERDVLVSGPIGRRLLKLMEQFSPLPMGTLDFCSVGGSFCLMSDYPKLLGDPTYQL
jgi:hypothetical protein